jgi:mannose-1-phosphate guanylyltransferase/phosphomannomutase
MNKNSKIKSFIEKPLWSDVFDDKVNTGIYIFDPEFFSIYSRR